jgi:hypothetical protein
MNSTSLTLGTQTAFDFYPPKDVGGQAPCLSWRLCPKMLNGARKNLSNLVLNIVIYLWDTTILNDMWWHIVYISPCVLHSNIILE